MAIAATDEDPIAREEIEKKMTSFEKATLRGCLQELDIVKQKLTHCYEKLDRLQGIWATNNQELQVLRAQYAALANVRVNGGPTKRD